jgi:hypothetical protein
VPDGQPGAGDTIGLYFMGFCTEQAPRRERMEAIYA